MYPGGCFKSYQWSLNCDFTISETTDDAIWHKAFKDEEPTFAAVTFVFCQIISL